ncbi:hypothetical protein DOY81_008534 [Sarcophaga bullata]|nr:hypothetical protein DOY81_008534 [Sarcophaga bullata]
MPHTVFIEFTNDSVNQAMNFQRILVIFATIFCCCCYQIIHGANDEGKKWHIIGGFLFYIELEQKYNPSEALQYCKSLGMDNYLRDNITFEFRKYYEIFYGIAPAIWEANGNSVYAGKRNYLIVRHDKVTTVTTDESSVEYGFICSANISKGYVKYKNAMETLITKDDVIQDCHPQSQPPYTQEYCLIVFD